MSYCETLEEAIKLARKIRGEQACITVIPDGVGVIVRNEQAE